MPVFQPALAPLPARRPGGHRLGTATAELSSPQEHDTKEGKMRQFFMVMLVALATGLMPAMVRAENPNQEAAQRISDHLTKSGQLAGDKIAVRYLNGTVWLQGHVRDQEHFNKAVALVFRPKASPSTR